jgi:hypothetical protein
MSNTIVKLKEIINNVTTEVIKGLKVDTTIVDIDLTVGCDLEVYNEAVRLCNLKKEEYALANKIFDKKKIPVCQACSFTDINQSIIVTINSQDIENNTIANGIKDGITNKLNTEISYLGTQNKNKAGSMTIIRDIIQNNFDTELVNNTIKNFSFKQSITILNMQAKNINQVLVATVISNTIINNLIENNQTFNNAVKVLDDNSIEEIPKNIPEITKTDYTNYYYLFIVFLCLILYSYFSKKQPRRHRQRQRRYY